MLNFLKKFFGTAQGRTIHKYQKIVKQINLKEEELQHLSEEEVINKTAELKQRYNNGESLDDLLVDAYAVVKNICRRLVGTDIHICGYNQKWDMIPYDVQILGAIAMHKGCIAEMQTGEGKTLTAAMPLYLNALSGEGVHLVTVNDYLAKRDCEWIGTIFKKLGLSVSPLTNDVPPHERKVIYNADIVYGTASEFGFDYLRDNSMATSKEEQCQRNFHFAIIDEVDSILIDEARTPLIISGPSPTSRQMYDKLKSGVSSLVRLQRDLCSKLASEARKELDSLGLITENEQEISLKKDDEQKAQEAYRKLWLVSKGTPCNKILRHIKENPTMRASIDQWENYYFSEQNKNEKSKTLSELYIIIDERGNEYELTDRGIQSWADFHGQADGANDFIMLDLGYEYATIDNNHSLSEEEKVQKKIKLREEDALRKERAHNLRQLFRAHLLMEKDVDYIIQDNAIIIIDENTGRPQPGRRFSDGLHQAIEAKEGVAIQKETQTYATITLQNYFRMYKKIAGMTGTAITEANEFKEIYKLEVLQIPTYCPSNRTDSDDEIYMTEREKYAAILKEIKDIHSKGRPILIGTESVEISEKLSRILKQNNLNHTVLNAKNHAKEAEIIAEAGNPSSITLATNMAGRGTDIKLKQNAKELGGLHVIGSTRHHSRRIDRQLRGRSGRLGDPGSTKFFVSFEDSLIRLFAPPRITMLLKRFRPPEGEPISAKILNKSIETAQKRIEQRNYTIRKHTLEYDDVMNIQRKEIYNFRNELLHTDNPIEIAHEILANAALIKISEFFIDRTEGKWHPEQYRQWLMANLPISFDTHTFDDEFMQIEEIEKMATSKVASTFDTKLTIQKSIMIKINPDMAENDQAKEILQSVVRNIMIRKIDHLWQEHLLAIDHLRSDVNLRVVGQKDPLIEFKQEAFLLFKDFSEMLKLEIAKDLFRFEMVSPQQQRLQDLIADMQLSTQKSFLPEKEDQEIITNQQPQEEQISKPIIVEKKTGRNELCHCGSGKKFKKCCGINQD
jgi:preprotein translocase subunit SecA